MFVRSTSKHAYKSLSSRSTILRKIVTLTKNLKSRLILLLLRRLLVFIYRNNLILLSKILFFQQNKF